MFRILKQLILTALFAVFATQASALFIQPDWLDPTQQGVGTNRYAYSGNDPINRLDPNGNAFFDWFDSQEKSDERNQEAADSYNDYADHLASQDPLGNDHEQFLRERKIERMRAEAASYQQRVGLSRNMRMRYDLGLSVRAVAGASAASVAPTARMPRGATIPNVAGINSNAVPNAHNAFIDPRKLTEYALNPNHPVGGNKARVFQSVLGINQRNADILSIQLQAGVRTQAATPGRVDQFGSRYTVDIPVRGPNGNATVTTGWIVREGSSTPSLTTLFVK